MSGARAEARTAAPRATKGVRLATALGVQDAGRLLRYFATYLPTQAIPALAGFLVLPILARRLFPTELGVLALAQTLVTLGWALTGNWLAVSIIREFPAYRERADVAGFARVLARALAWTGVAVLAFAGLLAAGGVFSSAVGENLPWILAAMAALVVQNVAVSLFAAGLRPRAYAVVEISARVGGIGLGVALVFLGHGVTGYLIGLAVSSAVIGAIGLAAAWPRAAGEPRGEGSPRLWLAFGGPAAAAAALHWGLQFVDRYLLAGLKDAGAVGIYTVGNVVGDRAVAIPMFAFIAAAVPLLVTAFERQGRAEVERLMRAYTRVALLVGLPVVALVAAVSDDLVPLLTGEERGDYSPAATVAPIVALGSLLFGLAAIASTGLSVAKRTRPLIYAGAIALAVNVVANLILVPPFGITGAAVATPIGMGAYLFAAALWARGHATWRVPWATALRACAAAGAAYACGWALTRVGDSRAADIALAAAGVAAAYVAALGLLGERRAGLPVASS